MALLAECHRRGLVTAEDYEAQLRRIRAKSLGGGGGDLKSLPTRRHGDGVRLDLRDQWFDHAGPFDTRSLALVYVRRKCAVHGHNGGEWKYNDHHSQGSKAYMHCNGHVKCPVQMRVRQKGADGKFYLQVTSRVEHALLLNHKRRANSPLPFGLERTINEWTARGVTPKTIKEELQIQLVRDYGFQKSPSGTGVQGAHGR